MFADSLCKRFTSAVTPTKTGKDVNKSDPTFMGIVFLAVICAVLPLDISQLAFAIIGAVFYALLQKQGCDKPKKKVVSVADAAPYHGFHASRTPKPKAWNGRSGASVSTKPPPEPVAAPEVRAPSVQPIVAPTFRSEGWDGEVNELLVQIMPTAEAERIVNQLARIIRHTVQPLIPEIEVHGFANGNLTFGKAFGVAVPEVDIIASVSPQVLFNRLHGRSAQGGVLDEKKLQKSAIRTCTDRLVSAGGFKFRRSAFRGQEPKVTLLVPASLGVFSDSIPIDFSVNVVTPLYNAALLTECGRIDGRAKELILIVRRWAKDRGICHSAKGHLSPYMWGLLTIYFLQVGSEEGPLLPPLQQFELSSELVRCKKAAPIGQSKWTPSESAEPKKAAADLFKEFVRFYDSQFDWRNEAVSIRASQRAPPSSELPLHIIVGEGSESSQVGPSVEDPFQAAQNLADHMTSASLKRLKEEFSRAETFCMRDASLTELLEPWVPPEAESAEPQDDEPAGKMAAPVQKAHQLYLKPRHTEDQDKSVRKTESAAAAAPWRRPVRSS